MRFEAAEQDFRRIEEALGSEISLLHPGDPVYRELRRIQSDVRYAIAASGLPENAPDVALEICANCGWPRQAGAACSRSETCLVEQDR